VPDLLPDREAALAHDADAGAILVISTAPAKPRPTTGLREERSLLSVANTGPVIPPEKVDLLFQPFGRLEDRVGRDGLGLGLSIVTAIAAAHEADLRARALPGGGLEVEVHFPRLPPGEAPEPATPGAREARGSAGVAGPLKAAARQA
jgi:signal transduction histidine kinase